MHVLLSCEVCIFPVLRHKADSWSYAQACLFARKRLR